MTKIVVLRNLQQKRRCQYMFPGALVRTSTRLDEFRLWASDEIYIEESAATPDILSLARKRQECFINPILEILPLWKIRLKFMTGHDAMALIAKREGKS